MWRYEFIEGPNKGEHAFDLYRLPEGLWIWESAYDEKVFHDVDELIDFMQSLNLQPPSTSKTGLSLH